MAVLVSRKAPDFVAPAVMPNNEIQEQFHFSQYIHDKYAVLFFYPLDFTLALRQIEWVGGRMLWSGRALNRS